MNRKIGRAEGFGVLPRQSAKPRPKHAHVEVDEQADGQIRQAQVGHHLRFVNWRQAFDRLELEQDLLLYNEVDTVAAIAEHSLVADRNGSLTLETHLAERQLSAQASLVRRLQEPRAQRSVHFDDAADDLLSPILKTSALPIFLLHLLQSVSYAARVRQNRRDAAPADRVPRRGLPA